MSGFNWSIDEKPFEYVVCVPLNLPRLSTKGLVKHSLAWQFERNYFGIYQEKKGRSNKRDDNVSQNYDINLVIFLSEKLPQFECVK